MRFSADSAGAGGAPAPRHGTPLSRAYADTTPPASCQRPDCAAAKLVPPSRAQQSPTPRPSQLDPSTATRGADAPRPARAHTVEESAAAAPRGAPSPRHLHSSRCSPPSCQTRPRTTLLDPSRDATDVSRTPSTDPLVIGSWPLSPASGVTVPHVGPRSTGRRFSPAHSSTRLRRRASHPGAILRSHTTRTLRRPSRASPPPGRHDRWTTPIGGITAPRLPAVRPLASVHGTSPALPRDRPGGDPSPALRPPQASAARSLRGRNPPGASEGARSRRSTVGPGAASRSG
jgi:hypothetical protein